VKHCIVLNDSKLDKKREEEEEVGGEREEDIREERKRKTHNFIEVHKEELGGEDGASYSGAFGCFLHLCDFPLGHRSLARLFQHLAFVAWCLSSKPLFTSMPIFHHQSAHRLHGHGAPHHGAILHLPLHSDCAPHVFVDHHRHTTNFLLPRC